MARAENVQTISGVAGEALAIYRFVHLMADGKFDYVDTDDLRADGVTAEAASADLDVIAIAPTSQPAVMKVEASAAIAVGDLVAADGGTGSKRIEQTRYTLGAIQINLGIHTDAQCFLSGFSHALKNSTRTCANTDIGGDCPGATASGPSLSSLQSNTFE